MGFRVLLTPNQVQNIYGVRIHSNIYVRRGVVVDPAIVGRLVRLKHRLERIINRQLQLNHTMTQRAYAMAAPNANRGPLVRQQRVLLAAQRALQARQVQTQNRIQQINGQGYR